MAIRNVIIKSSFSRLKNGTLKSNFGDLLRSTVLLECLEDDYVWLTDSRSIPLLKWFVESDRLIDFNDNLKDYDISDQANIFNIDNYVSDETIFKQLTGKWNGYIKAGGDSVLAANEFIKTIEPYSDYSCGVSWQESLIKGMGFEWNSQDYSNCQMAGAKARHDVGFNWHVHHEWTSKQWPEQKWKELEKMLLPDYSVSWQEGINDFDEYIKWISSCKLIVTCDTLGLHLASALGIDVVAITGVTECNEHSYNRVAFIKPDERDCMPCNKPVCKYGCTCLDDVQSNNIEEIVVKRLKRLKEDKCINIAN